MVPTSQCHCEERVNTGQVLSSESLTGRTHLGNIVSSPPDLPLKRTSHGLCLGA